MDVDMELFFNSDEGTFTLFCTCGFTTTGFTLAKVGRDYDVHRAMVEPIGTKRKPCDMETPRRFAPRRISPYEFFEMESDGGSL